MHLKILRHLRLINMKKPFLTIIFLFLSVSFLYAGTPHYVDTTASGPLYNGTWGDPFKTIQDVNDYNFSTGDDVYFKVGQTWTISTTQGLNIDWYGDDDPEDYVTIGAWSAEGNFTLNGNARPIISGNNNNYPSGDYSSLIRRELGSQGTGWIKVENLKLEYSKWYALLFKKISNFVVDNCWTYRNAEPGILIVRSHTGVVSDNIVDQSSYNRPPGAGIEITGADNLNNTYDITVTRNKVHRGHEGIGVYKRARNITIEHNHIWDNNSYHLYVDASSNIIFRFNTVYNSVTKPPDGQFSSLVVFDNEDERAYCYYDDNEIYGNRIAGGLEGIKLSNSKEGCASSGHRIYNNTLVDNKTNIKMGSDGGSFSDVLIKNLISWTITGGDSTHTVGCNESGVTWNNNLWSSDPGSGSTGCDNDATDPPNASPDLEKASGWRNFVAGGAIGTEWQPNPGSPANSGGTDLGNGLEYTLIPNTGDVSATPFDPFTPADADDSAWPYGAFVADLFISGLTPASGSTGNSITVDANWTNPGTANTVTILFDKKAEHDPPTTEIHSGSLVTTHDLGTLDYDTEYAIRIDVVHDGGTQEGVVYYFTTTSELNPPTPTGGGIEYHKNASEIGYNKSGASIQ
jgi:Periplasmic copper-binding protein (NosD)